VSRARPARRGAARVRRVLLAAALVSSLRLLAPAPPGAEPPEPEGPEPTPEAAAAEPAPGWDRGLSEVISPGPLAAAHAGLEGVSHCNDCHTWLGGTPDASCLGCHEVVGERMAGRLGFHGKLEGSCTDCHGDHRGREADLLGLDREGFAHDQATFALRGAHADVDCGDCHHRAHPETGREAFRPIGIPSDCAACHESPHAERLVRDRDCEGCHVAAAWSAPVRVEAAADTGFDSGSETGFDHGADTRFPLDALHAPVPCASCHEGGVAEPPPRACASCHEAAAALLAGRFGGRRVAPDPHAEATECHECHPASTAKPTLADHAAVCTACHPDSYAPLLATRRALLDEALVAARLAAKGAEARRRIEVLARSGLHHPELAEALALELARRPR